MIPAPPPAPLPAARSPRLPPPPRRVIVRFAAFVLFFLVLGAVVFLTPLRDYLTRDQLRTTLEALRLAWWSPLALIGLYLVLAPAGLPVTPLVLAGGAVFGPRWGSLYSLAGCFLGALLSYLLARALGREMVVHVVGDRLKRAERLLVRHGFWSLVGVRFLPIPFPVINFGAALAGIPLPMFLGSTVLGLTPPILIYSYFAAALSQAAGQPVPGLKRNIAIAFGALLLLSMVPVLWRMIQRRRRYRYLLTARKRNLR